MIFDLSSLSFEIFLSLSHIMMEDFLLDAGWTIYYIVLTCTKV